MSTSTWIEKPKIQHESEISDELYFQNEYELVKEPITDAESIKENLMGNVRDARKRTMRKRKANKRMESPVHKRPPSRSDSYKRKGVMPMTEGGS